MDPYGILGLEPSATPEEVKKAHRKLLRLLHPDMNPDPIDHGQYLYVQAAYEAITENKPFKAPSGIDWLGYDYVSGSSEARTKLRSRLTIATFAQQRLVDQRQELVSFRSKLADLQQQSIRSQSELLNELDRVQSEFDSKVTGLLDIFKAITDDLSLEFMTIIETLDKTREEAVKIANERWAMQCEMITYEKEALAEDYAASLETINLAYYEATDTL